MRRRSAVVGLWGALLLSGCYRYVPVALDAAPVGPEVRVFVSRRGMAELPEDIPTGGTYVTGRIVRQSADSLLIQVPVRRRVEDASGLDLRQNLFLPVAEIVDIRRRELSASRTALAVAGAAGFATVVVVGILDAGSNTDVGGDDPPDQIRIPLDMGPSAP